MEDRRTYRLAAGHSPSAPTDFQALFATTLDPAALSLAPLPRTAIAQNATVTLLRRVAACVAIAWIVCALSGCSLFVMAGKMLMGDPIGDAAFYKATNVDLTMGEHSVLIIATTPQSAKTELPGVEVSIVEEVSRRMRSKGIEVYPSREVLNWVDDRGGQWGTPDEIAAKFDADFIVEIDIDRLSFHEENSPDLYRGNAVGVVRAHEVVESGRTRVASPVFTREFTSTFPSHHPKQAHQISVATFRHEFLERVCNNIAQLFYNHHAGETVY